MDQVLQELLLLILAVLDQLLAQHEGINFHSHPMSVSQGLQRRVETQQMVRWGKGMVFEVALWVRRA